MITKTFGDALKSDEADDICSRIIEKATNESGDISTICLSLVCSILEIRNQNKVIEGKDFGSMDDYIYNDSVQLYGLKKYLLEFSRMDTKEVMEVKLWDEYLMFAYLFGIADKVAKQLKDMYPEVVEEMQSSNIDYNTLYYINHISVRSTSSASSARSAAQSYSSGGGGFSSGGGGGGSFGGGGGGSR